MHLCRWAGEQPVFLAWVKAETGALSELILPPSFTCPKYWQRPAVSALSILTILLWVNASFPINPCHFIVINSSPLNQMYQVFSNTAKLVKKRKIYWTKSNNVHLLCYLFLFFSIYVVLLSNAFAFSIYISNEQISTFHLLTFPLLNHILYTNIFAYIASV